MWNRKAVVSEEVVTFLKKNGILEDGRGAEAYKKNRHHTFSAGVRKGGYLGFRVCPQSLTIYKNKKYFVNSF